jgi:alpha-amylase
MNWDALEDRRAAEVLEHWRKLGRFRREHPAVGGGVHRTHQQRPYIWSRTLEVGGRKDRVVVAMDLRAGKKSVPVFGVFPEGAKVVDGYSGWAGTVRGGSVTLTTPSGLVLLGERR